ncbi:MAG: tetratricopeptide repeat protein [Myxococcota bacterium]
MGRIVKHEEIPELKAKLKKFAAGEATWAEVEGMTFEEAQAIAQVGCELAAAGRLEEARIIFEGLVEGNPKDAASHAALGTVYQKLGRTTDAKEAYSAALEHDPNSVVALAYRGVLRLQANDQNGFSDLTGAVEADPKGETTAGRRARALVEAITLMAVEAGKAARPGL